MYISDVLFNCEKCIMLITSRRCPCDCNHLVIGHLERTVSYITLNSFRTKIILYCICSTLFLILRRKVMISNMFHLFLQFQILNSSLLFNLSFICNFANNAIFNFCIAAIHNYSYSIRFPVLNFI